MSFASGYLSKQKAFSPSILQTPNRNLGFIVVIPVFCEPDIIHTLNSLWNCERPSVAIEVILVLNSPENASEEIVTSNQLTLQIVQQWLAMHDSDPSMVCHLMDARNMPLKDAGVGLARKKGMDEALHRFNSIGHNHGYIVSFDADSTCDPNYFTALHEALSAGKNITGFDVYFEHPLEGIEFAEKVYEGIIRYEIHLRYVNLFLRFTGFPYAHHTIGSCFGVRADIYAAQGGMNKRKAGEDFYFLHKIIPLGDFIDINTTRVIPSSRVSLRVPFGTGIAVDKYVSENEDFLTYSPSCFFELKQFISFVPQFYRSNKVFAEKIVKSLPQTIMNYLDDINIYESVSEINVNAASPETFILRFFRWFNAFRIVKYLNYASRTTHSRIPVNEAGNSLLAQMKIEVNSPLNNRELLVKLRELERY